ncbi:MAG: hypothetical protein DRH30_10470 [Deltaproteobacteria bacterium]|nr:MAG: hypothetical protein DRQ32_03280 [bacterium]RLB39103.1 MAG: hypothetical protein DRH30_10470 [Deltaproteobacteria bacterium]
MNPYRESARPEFLAGDEVHVAIPWWLRVVLPPEIRCWHGYRGEIWMMLTFGYVGWPTSMNSLFPGERGAHIDLPDGGSIAMPLKFLRRSR